MNDNILAWLPSWLDRGHNVDAQGCGTSVFRGPTGVQVGRFLSWCTVVPKGSSSKVPTSGHE